MVKDEMLQWRDFWVELVRKGQPTLAHFIRALGAGLGPEHCIGVESISFRNLCKARNSVWSIRRAEAMIMDIVEAGLQQRSDLPALLEKLAGHLVCSQHCHEAEVIGGKWFRAQYFGLGYVKLPVVERRAQLVRLYGAEEVHRKPMEDCSICLETVYKHDLPDLVWCAAGCGHNFHGKCLEPHLLQGRKVGYDDRMQGETCPLW